MSLELSLFQRLNKIEDDIKLVLNQQKTILEQLQKLDKTSKKMEGHINLVEGAYDTLKSPLDYITNRVNSLTGEETKALPSIEYKNEIIN